MAQTHQIQRLFFPSWKGSVPPPRPLPWWVTVSSLYCKTGVVFQWSFITSLLCTQGMILWEIQYVCCKWCLCMPMFQKKDVKIETAVTNLRDLVESFLKDPTERELFYKVRLWLCFVWLSSFSGQQEGCPVESRVRPKISVRKWAGQPEGC